MPDGAIYTEQEAEDFVRGLMLLGTGGGGDPEVGLRNLLDHIRARRPLRWTDLSSVPDDAWTCSVFGMGSIAPQESLSAEERRRLGYGEVRVEYPMVTAVEELAHYTGLDIQVIVAFEPGAGNTPGPMDAAARLGLTFVDADYAGRAIPELSQTLVAIAGHNLWPAAICDPWDNRLILKSAPSAQIGERLGKMISIVTQRPDRLGTCAHAGFLLPASEMKNNVVAGTLTLALRLGTAIRMARERQQDALKAATDVLGGWLLFTGVVTRKDWESRDGYMFGTTFIDGTGAFASHTYRIWFQNENHIVWHDDVPYVTSPDLIMVVDQATAEPYTNTALATGQRVAVLGAKSDSRYRSEAGLAALGPKHFGFDLPYRPIESVVA